MHCNESNKILICVFFVQKFLLPWMSPVLIETSDFVTNIWASKALVKIKCGSVAFLHSWLFLFNCWNRSCIAQPTHNCKTFGEYTRSQSFLIQDEPGQNQVGGEEGERSEEQGVEKVGVKIIKRKEGKSNCIRQRGFSKPGGGFDWRAGLLELQVLPLERDSLPVQWGSSGLWAVQTF